MMNVRRTIAVAMAVWLGVHCSGLARAAKIERPEGNTLERVELRFGPAGGLNSGAFAGRNFLLEDLNPEVQEKMRAFLTRSRELDGSAAQPLGADGVQARDLALVSPHLLLIGEMESAGSQLKTDGSPAESEPRDEPEDGAGPRGEESLNGEKAPALEMPSTGEVERKAEIHRMIEGVLAEFAFRPAETVPEAGLDPAPVARDGGIPGRRDRSRPDRLQQERDAPPEAFPPPQEPANGAPGAHHSDLMSAGKKALLIDGLLLAIELAGGWITGSLALMADSMHVAIDLGLTAAPLASLWIAGRLAERGKTYNHQRTEAVIGLAGTGAIALTAGEIAAHAYRHLAFPAVVPGAATILLALPGLILNSINAGIFYRHKDRNLSFCAAFRHFASDAMGSLSVIVAGLLTLCFGWAWADPAAGFFIAVLILSVNLTLGVRSWKALLKKN